MRRTNKHQRMESSQLRICYGRLYLQQQYLRFVFLVGVGSVCERNRSQHHVVVPSNPLHPIRNCLLHISKVQTKSTKYEEAWLIVRRPLRIMQLTGNPPLHRLGLWMKYKKSGEAWWQARWPLNYLQFHTTTCIVRWVSSIRSNAHLLSTIIISASHYLLLTSVEYSCCITGVAKTAWEQGLGECFWHGRSP